MNKIYGTRERQDGLYCIGRNKWELIYGFGKDSDDAETGYNYRQRFTRKPEREEVMSIVRAQINADTEEKIQSGFSWEGNVVWLSKENQFNYKEAFDTAVQTNGETLPVTFKFGTDDVPFYYTFNDINELQSFVLAAFAHIKTALAEGWKEKDNLDPTVFGFER